MLRIAIIGLGLIGTSLGMALRSADPGESGLGPIEIAGFDQDHRAIKEARGRLAIDRECRSLADAVRDAQVVVVATPVGVVADIFREMAGLLSGGTIVTDVASTKTQVRAWAEELLPIGVSYVGGHPMAGSEQSGAKAADPTLFKDVIYCLTATPTTAQQAVQILEALVQAIGAKPYFIDPQEHDAYVAGISHLPFLLAVGLAEITGRSPAWKEMAPLAATGFRDTSRLASGDPQMHRDICLTNREGINRWLNEMIAFLVETREQINNGDRDALEALLQRAKQQRDEWLAARPNLRPGEDDFNRMPELDRPSLIGFRRPGCKDR
jgi:prephenate dehydrogenase